MITTPTVSGKPGQAPTGLSCDLYPLIGSHSTWTDPRGPVRGVMITTFSEWADEQKANETPAQAELRRRSEAGFALGLQFIEARQARGLTQRQLSEITGVTQADISRIERGAGNPTEATLKRLAEALGRRLELVNA